MTPIREVDERVVDGIADLGVCDSKASLLSRGPVLAQAEGGPKFRGLLEGKNLTKVWLKSVLFHWSAGISS